MNLLGRELRRTVRLASLLLVATLAACSETPGERLDRIAREYIEQAMYLDRLRPGEVDLWFGPDHLDTRGEPAKGSLQDVRAAASALRETLADVTTERGQRLAQRVAELEAVASFLAADPPMSFVEQAERLYAVDWVETDTLGIDEARDRLDAALTGRGTLRARIGGERKRLLVPAERRQALFETAFAECRRRTLAHWSLPANESVELVFTREVRAAQHHYEGNGRSTLSINPLAIATVDQALEVACHEGYPGHHAQLVLFESAAGEAGLPLEDRLVLLRSPASAFREGAAMAGVDLVFPAQERLAFEREVLFPMAGLDPALAERYARIRPDLERMALAVPAIIRDHEDRQLSDAEAINRLQTEALVASPRALFAFAHEVGAYLAGYTLLDAALDARLRAAGPARAWEQLRRWLEEPARGTRALSSEAP